MTLSSRSWWSTQTNDLHNAVCAAQASGRRLIDLTRTNPTTVGLTHPGELYGELGRSTSARYEPEPLGSKGARSAVAAYYNRRGCAIDPARIWLTSSTSEAYWQLCTLLCDPGEAVAIPAPGYPLLDHVARAASVELHRYRVEFDGDWYLDARSLDAALGLPSTRAAIAVCPNNPTGMVMSSAERELVEHRCKIESVPLIIDEVFADYPVEATTIERWVPADCAGFVVSGLSKVAALPQLKLSWVIVNGSDSFLEAVLRRAELLCDAFLSVSTPVQLALEPILAAADVMQERIRCRCRENLRTLDAALAGQPLDRSPVAGGWSVVLRLPEVSGLDDEGWALRFLASNVVTQPGYLFDLEGPPRVVISLLTPGDPWRRGIDRMVDATARAIRENPM